YSRIQRLPIERWQKSERFASIAAGRELRVSRISLKHDRLPLPKAVQLRRPVPPLARDSARRFHDVQRKDPFPEVPLVERATRDRLVSPLQLREAELLRQQ